MTSISSRVRRSQTFLLALLASGAVFTAGCANMATTAGGSGSSGDAVTLGGTIHGGNQPVSGATVTLWFAGQGVNSPAVLAATATSANDGAGSFSFAAGASNGGTLGNTYKCPVQTNSPYVYVVATGGNTQGSGSFNNTASVFLAPYGPCNTLSASSFVDMTEVTTVATMAALQQYFIYSATAPVIAQTFDTGGSGLSYNSMGFALNMIPNMVNLANGTAITSKTITGTPGVGIFTAPNPNPTTVVATPETAKINTIANILAACINDTVATGPECTTLFANAAPPASASTTAQPGATYTAPVNTLQAAYYMLSNPTNGSTIKLGKLFGLSPASGAPFQPTLSAVPTDWTIAISYASSSQCGGANSSTGGHLIQSVQDIAIDQNGDIWLANNEAGGNLSVLQTNNSATSPNTVVPAGCIQIGSGLNTGITIDYVTTGLANIWLADSGQSNVYRYHPTSAANTATAFAAAAAPASIAADGAGNVYFTSSTTSDLYAIPQGASNSPVTPISIATSIGSGSRVLVDSSPAVWTTSGTTSITRTACSAPNTAAGCTSTSISTVGPTYGIGVSPLSTITPPSPALPFQQNSVYFSAEGNSTTSSVSLFQGGPTTSYVSANSWPVTAAISGLNAPTAVAVDGAQNVWAINNFATANSVVEIGAGKQLLSGATGFQKSATYLGSGRSMVIDPSGNVWIGLDGANSITQMVGAAVPVYQPYALGLHNGLFQTIP